MHTSTNLTVDMTGGPLRPSFTTVDKDQAQQAADSTLSVTEKVDLLATPSQVWEAIKDFNGWQAWHPAFASTDIIQGQGNTQGTVRVLTARTAPGSPRNCSRTTTPCTACNTASSNRRCRSLATSRP